MFIKILICVLLFQFHVNSLSLAPLEIDDAYDFDEKEIKSDPKEHLHLVGQKNEKSNMNFQTVKLIPAPVNTDNLDLVKSEEEIFSNEDSARNLRDEDDIPALSILADKTEYEGSSKFQPLTFSNSLFNVSVPQFMVNLFNSLSNSNGENRYIPHKADIVRSIPERNPIFYGRFEFDISGISTSDDIVEAELHIYRTSLNPSSSYYYTPYYIVRAYQVMPNDNHRLLSVHYIPYIYSGWQIFKVKTAVESWIKGSTQNLGLLVEATVASGEPVRFEFVRRNLHPSQFEPALIVFSKTKTKTENLNSLSALQSYRGSLIESREPSITSENNCQKLSMYIDLKIFDWIIAPKEYFTNKCVGNCKREIPNKPIITRLQKILAHLEKDPIKVGCCGPTKFKSLHLLYLDTDQSVIYQELADMIVEDCGCR